ncbi:16666_t:CDS:1 [Acaulospora colombiana]|uniref:16666_t:CDS:1 n=1 Tax=Acaulospora colombiana TaxID=27376 RepID=A0ACA9KAV3_9GLOM|nr:16666_t:CDS:1 [Acaulospora colombiana]
MDDMLPNGLLFPNLAEFFQDLPSAKEPGSTMSIDQAGPVIVRPFPDIQTYIGVHFQHTIPTTPYYIVLPDGGDTNRLLFSANFDPPSTGKWVRFDEKSRKLIGKPSENANRNTTVLLHISDPIGGSTDTTMHILVSNCVGEMCANYIPREILVVIITLSVAFGVCLLSIFGFILFKRTRDKRSSARKPFASTNENLSTINRRESNGGRSHESMQIYRNRDFPIPSIESDVQQRNGQVVMYNFENIAILNGDGLLYPEISNVETRTPQKVERDTPSSNFASINSKRHVVCKEDSDSSLYSHSSATASCDNVSQTMTLSGIKQISTPEDCTPVIPTMLYAKPENFFSHQVKYPLPSLNYYRRQEFTAVTDPDDGPLPKWLHFHKIQMKFSGVPSQLDIGQTKIKVLKIDRDLSSQDDNINYLDCNFKVVEKILLIVEGNDDA